MSDAPLLLDLRASSLRELTPVAPTAPDQDARIWLRELLHQHPALLPVEQFGGVFAPLVPVACGFDTGCGVLDNLYVSPHGRLTVVMVDAPRPDCASASVEAVLEHGRQLARWSYDQLRELANSISGDNQAPLGTEFDTRLRAALDRAGVSATEFSTSIVEGLAKANFLLLVVGQQISAEVLKRTREVQSACGLALTLGLVELAFFRPDAQHPTSLLATRRVLGLEHQTQTLRSVLDATLEVLEKNLAGERWWASWPVAPKLSLVPSQGPLFRFVPLTTFHGTKSCRAFHDRLQSAAVPWRTHVTSSEARVFVSQLHERRARQVLQEHLASQAETWEAGFPRSYDYVIFGALIGSTFGMILLAADFRNPGDLSRPFWLVLLGALVGWVIEKGRRSYRATGAWGLSLLDLAIATCAALMAIIIFLVRIRGVT